MSTMLTMASRRIPRAVIRTLNKYLDKSTSEVPVQHCYGVRTICKYGFKPTEIITGSSKSVCGRTDRYIRTSSFLLQSETIKCPAFPESVTEGDIRPTAIRANYLSFKVARSETFAFTRFIDDLALVTWAGGRVFADGLRGRGFEDAVRIEKKVGDAVAQDEVVAEIETDKTSMPVHSPFHGIIEEFLVKDGDAVKAGQPLFKLKVTGEAPAKGAPAAKEAPAAAPPPTPAPAAAAPPSPPKPAAAASPTAPAAPRPAAPLSSIPVAAIRHAQSLEATAIVKLPPADPTKEISGTRTEQRVKMNRMRLKIAQRLKEAQNVNAMLTTFNEIDMTNIMEFRKANLDPFMKKYGIKLGFMSAFMKASAYALQDQPVVNAVIDGNEIIYRDYVDISVAVATPKGLVVPVVRNVQSMNFADIELAMGALGEKARKGQIAVEDMDGGTFTISNGGVFGSLMGTPIINPPQSSILGMHGIFERPIALKGQVVIRPMMYVALTYDHRLIDGREAVLFLRKIKQGVEDPRTMLAGL